MFLWKDNKYGGKEEKKAQYIVNAIDLRNYVDIEDINDEDDDIS